jgi:hypothetical protein
VRTRAQRGRVLLSPDTALGLLRFYNGERLPRAGMTEVGSKADFHRIATPKIGDFDEITGRYSTRSAGEIRVAPHLLKRGVTSPL